MPESPEHEDETAIKFAVTEIRCMHCSTDSITTVVRSFKGRKKLTFYCISCGAYVNVISIGVKVEKRVWHNL